MCARGDDWVRVISPGNVTVGALSLGDMHVFIFLLDRCQGGGRSYDSVFTLCKQIVSKVVVSFCIPSTKGPEFQLLHILANAWYCQL